MPVLPVGVSARSFSAALASFRIALGSEWVFTDDDPRLSTYEDAMPVDDPKRYAPGAALAPADVAQVQAILKIANHHRVPLWVFSTGRNLGYGGAAPRANGSVCVDLARLNQIIEVNEQSAYCVVEPGVTYFELYQHLQERKVKLWASPPEPGWASVVGNALDRYVGYTPMGDNFAFSCGMEVVLADGTIVRTGMGAMANSNTWHLFKYGYGPAFDGLFSQGNFGIVTKMGMWLMPEPPGYRSYMVTFPKESDLHQIIEVMRPLRINQIIQNCGMVTPWTYEATLTASRSQFWPGDGAIPQHAKQAAINRLGIGFWNVYGAQYGTEALMDEYWKILRGAFSQIAGARFFFAEERPELVGLQLRNLLAKGVPNMTTFNVLNWIPNGGHISFSPISPCTGEHSTRLYTMLKEEAEAVGFDYIGGFIIGWREMHNVLLVIFDKFDQKQRDTARSLFAKLLTRAASEGYGEYRTHIAFMDEIADSYDYNDHAALHLSERIKDALDPNGILSAGKSGIWPKHLRRNHL